ncbi:uncharacterized protein LOC143233064 [Tachypleus tridentatus]|uniref:uncharacterized protein LOC143233064 n=1 Tax=Tachypleus tridentatus TaxID=6853 RepID=UPI003FD5A564
MYENMTFHQREPKGPLNLPIPAARMRTSLPTNFKHVYQNIQHDVRNDTSTTSTISSETNLPRPRKFKHLNIKSLRPTHGKSTKPINPIINLPVILSRSFIKPLDKNQNQQTNMNLDTESSEKFKTSSDDKHMASEQLSKNPSFSTNNEGLVYADLSLSHSGARPVCRRNAPTEYATLNFTEEAEYVAQTVQPRHK